jgi:hypothetical protein
MLEASHLNENRLNGSKLESQDLIVITGAGGFIGGNLVVLSR